MRQRAPLWDVASFGRWVWVSVALACASACNPFDTILARRIARDGNALYRAGDYRGAIAQYREALELDPSTPNANLNLGYALFNTYNPESTEELDRRAAAEAVDAFDKHLEQVPDDEKAKIFRIKTLLRAAPKDAALADRAFNLFVELLRVKPDDQEVRNYLVTLLIDTKGYDRALEYFGAQLQTKPTDIDTMKALALIAEKSDRLDEAMGWYRKRAEAVTDPHERAALYYDLGTTAWNILHYQPDKVFGVSALKLADEGIAACRKAMGLKEDYAEAMTFANLLYLKRAIYEPTEMGKAIDLTLAFELRTQAQKIANSRPRAAAAP